MALKKFQTVIILVGVIALLVVTVASAGAFEKAQAFQSCMVNAQPVSLLVLDDENNIPWANKAAVTWLFGAQAVFEGYAENYSTGYTGSISPFVLKTASTIAACLQVNQP